MNKCFLEIAVFNFESALIADECGADRIELCQNYPVGGVSPTFENIKQVKKNVNIPVNVFIHPRVGNYYYNKEELSEIKKTILFCKELEMNGVVFGVVNSKNEIDFEVCGELVNLALPLSTTFHRAFDGVTNPEETIDKLIECGFNRILTSGKSRIAAENLDLLKKLIEYANDKIIIMPGGGIRSTNASQIIESCKPKEIHTAAITGSNFSADKNEIIKLKNIIS